jgi:hypothetical protein
MVHLGGVVVVVVGGSVVVGGRVGAGGGVVVGAGNISDVVCSVVEIGSLKAVSFTPLLSHGSSQIESGRSFGWPM